MLSSYIQGATVTTPPSIFRTGRLLLEPPISQQAGKGGDPLRTPTEEQQRIVDAVYMLRQHESNEKTTVQAKADAAWAAWNNEHLFGDKAEWQEQARIPKAWIHTERAVSTFMEFITVVPDWFDIESVLPSQEFAVNLIKNLIKHDLGDDRVGFWPLLEDTFRELYIAGNAETFVGYERDKMPIMESEPAPEQSSDEESSKLDIDFSLFGSSLNDIGTDMGLLSEQEDPASGDKILLPAQNVPRLRLERIPFERVWRDSSGKKRYIIWTSYCNAGDFRHEAELRGWDPDAVERAIHAGSQYGTASGANISRTKMQGQRGGSGATAPDVEFAVEITHFQGILYDLNEKGEVIFRDKYVAVANGQLLFEPMTPPFWDGEFPLVSSKIARNPNSVYGKSIVAENVEIFDLQISILLQLADALQRELDPSYEWDRNQMPDINPQTRPLGPGVVYPVMKNGQQGPAITKIAAGSFDGNVANSFQMINTILDGMSGATQDGGGAPRSRNRMTGMETAIREQQREGLNSFFFQNIDKEFLTPLLRLSLLRSLQFRSDKEWKLWVLANEDALVPKEAGEMRQKWLEQFKKASEWNARERFKNLGAFFRFKVKILGNALQRQMAVERVTSLLNVVRQSPEMMSAINIQYILTKMVEALGWDPEQALKATSNVAPEADSTKIMDSANQPFSAPNLFGQSGVSMGVGSDRGPGSYPTEAPSSTPGM